MKWYITKLVFKVITGGGNHTPQFDEQVRIIEARNFNEAFFKARFIGGREEDAFITEDLNSVKWEFVDLIELKEIDDFKDGMELCSRIHETESGEAYINFVQHRARKIENQTKQQLVTA
ncbi:MAG: DUF4288 domain-containing protein [Bacteroidia bacterium]|nr:DUF4288 domain-containing protein [Bacteroidia bacterium]MBP9689842.1 DUF4288 domain-containing protein [Bacteroidia bacterium]